MAYITPSANSNLKITYLFIHKFIYSSRSICFSRAGDDNNWTRLQYRAISSNHKASCCL